MATRGPVRVSGACLDGDTAVKLRGLQTDLRVRGAPVLAASRDGARQRAYDARRCAPNI